MSGSDTLYRAIFEAAPDGVIIASAEGTIEDANPAALVLFGYSLDELRGRPVEVLVPPALREEHQDHRRRFTRDPHARPMGVGLTLRGAKKDGSIFPVEISLSPLDVEGERHVIALVRDTTEHRRLQSFGTGALKASEDERQRIARELHDDTAQRIATILVRLRILERDGLTEEGRPAFEEIRDQLASCADSIRRIARGLRPPELEDAGVGAAILSHLRTVFEGSDIEVSVDLDPIQGRLTPEGDLVLYRTMQEAISNAVRHARPGSIAVTVQDRGDRIVAEVRDDGSGFNVDRVRGTDLEGLGLLGMGERASMVSGWVRIESEPGEGTCVRIELPTAGDADGETAGSTPATASDG